MPKKKNFEDISNCHFVPHRTMEKVVDAVNNVIPLADSYCQRDLLSLQMSSIGDQKARRWRALHRAAVSRAIYSHDWNKLLYLLKKSPIWEHHPKKYFELQFYIRALTILLMNHPHAKEVGSLKNYLHMVLGCRSDNDKKAIMKTILMLTDRIYNVKVCYYA